MECNISANKKNCTCTYEPCSRKGKCCECVLYHRRNGEIPGCFFPADVERTYSRSVKRFVQAFEKEGK